MYEQPSISGATPEHEKSREELYTLLLSFEEEAIESKRQGDGPSIQREKSGEHEVILYGTEHVFTLEGAEEMALMFEKEKPDLLLVEGASPERLIDSELTDEEVVARFGEQAYMVRLAERHGVEVRSWDSPPAEQLAEAIKTNGEETTIAWIVFMAAKHLLKQKKEVTEEGLRGLMNLFLDAKTLAELKERGLPIDPASYDVQKLVQTYSKKTLAEIDPATAEFYATPWHQGTTNDVNRTMIQQRDRHAIDALMGAKRLYSKIFVTAGADHVLTWKKAVQKMYES